MNIIPVIDYMGGRVVLAENGMRENYRPVNSELCKQSDIHSVLQELIAFANFNTVYIADLDSIVNQQLDYSLWRHIFRSYPDIQFWCDFGTQVAAWDQIMATIENARPIIGSESFSNMHALNVAIERNKPFRPLLSLDFKDGTLMGPANLYSDIKYWPKEIIALSLNRVGSSTGPDYALIQKLQKQLPVHKLFVGGGVRHGGDLESLFAKKISGILLAKSIHTKSISATEIAEFIG